MRFKPLFFLDGRQAQAQVSTHRAAHSATNERGEGAHTAINKQTDKTDKQMGEEGRREGGKKRRKKGFYPHCSAQEAAWKRGGGRENG